MVNYSGTGVEVAVRASGDLTGVQDSANIAAALAASKDVQLAPGKFYVNVPVQVGAGKILSGGKGCGPSIYDSSPPATGTIITPGSAWSAAGVTNPAVVQAAGLGVHLRDFWVDASPLAHGTVVDGVNDGAGFNSVNLRNVGVYQSPNNGFTQYGSEWSIFQCVVNIAWLDGFHGLFTDSNFENCFAQTCGLSGNGAGYSITGSQLKMTACRGDLSQYGFFFDCGTSAGYTDMIQLTGCSTQRNNLNGIQIQNSDNSGGGRVPVILTGCVLDGDGVNGTLAATGGTPAGSGTITGGAGGGGWAGLALHGAVTVKCSGLMITAGTRDSPGNPQYGISTATANGNPPNLVDIESGLINAITAAYNDAGASVVFRTGTNVDQYTGAVYAGSPSTLTSRIAPSLVPPVTLPDFAPGGRLLTGCVAATMPVSVCSATTGAPTSGQLNLTSIMLEKGQVITNMLMAVSNTGESGGTHGWYVLLDSSRVVRAVTADQVGATVWAAFAGVALAFTAPYTVAATGRYLVGVCIVATGMPTFCGREANAISAPGGANGFSPSWVGVSSTGQTTPPAVAATMAALTSPGASSNFYVELS